MSVVETCIYNHSFLLLVTRTYYHVKDVRTEERAGIQMNQIFRLQLVLNVNITTKYKRAEYMQSMTHNINKEVFFFGGGIIKPMFEVKSMK